MPTTQQLRREHEPLLLSIAQAGFETSLVAATFDNLESAGPLCFNNFAYALRELLRHVFHRLAPDQVVTQAPWYKPDPNSKSGITRSHRSKYMLQGGLSDYFIGKLGIDVASVNSDLSDAFEVLNSFTHIGTTTFALRESEVETNAETCLQATKYLIDHIAECRTQVLEALSREIDHHLLNEAISGTINDLGELATHHLIEGVYVDSAEVVDIGLRDLTIDIEGTVEAELQYGSGSDLRNDIGVLMSDSFPFTANMRVPFKRPLGKAALVFNFKVDTSCWYGE